MKKIFLVLLTGFMAFTTVHYNVFAVVGTERYHGYSSGKTESASLTADNYASYKESQGKHSQTKQIQLAFGILTALDLKFLYESRKRFVSPDIDLLYV